VATQEPGHIPTIGSVRAPTGPAGAAKRQLMGVALTLVSPAPRGGSDLDRNRSAVSAALRSMGLCHGLVENPVLFGLVSHRVEHVSRG
jgi:hypothetical protein